MNDLATMEIITNDDYWDCECEVNYIHRKSLLVHCPYCDCWADDQPDSRQEEIDQLYCESNDVFAEYSEYFEGGE